MWTWINTSLAGPGHLLCCASLTGLTALLLVTTKLCRALFCGQQVQPLLSNKTSWAVMQTSFASTHDKAWKCLDQQKSTRVTLLYAHYNLTFVLFCRGIKKKQKKPKPSAVWSPRCSGGLQMKPQLQGIVDKSDQPRATTKQRAENPQCQPNTTRCCHAEFAHIDFLYSIIYSN